jgi:peroxiredoxin-like protein
MTMLDSYTYQAELEWTEHRKGLLRAEGLPALAISAPPEFSGAPGLWTPEHLLLGATASCLMTTYLAIANLMKLEVASFRMQAYGRLEKVPGEGYRFTEITLVPEIGIAAGDVEKAEKVLSKAEKNCFVSNSLRSTVQVEPRYRIIPAAVAH